MWTVYVEHVPNSGKLVVELREKACTKVHDLWAQPIEMTAVWPKQNSHLIGKSHGHSLIKGSQVAHDVKKPQVPAETSRTFTSHARYRC